MLREDLRVIAFPQPWFRHQVQADKELDAVLLEVGDERRARLLSLLRLLWLNGADCCRVRIHDSGHRVTKDLDLAGHHPRQVILPPQGQVLLRVEGHVEPPAGAHGLKGLQEEQHGERPGRGGHPLVGPGVDVEGQAVAFSRTACLPRRRCLRSRLTPHEHTVRCHTEGRESPMRVLLRALRDVDHNLLVGLQALLNETARLDNLVQGGRTIVVIVCDGVMQDLISRATHVGLIEEAYA
mmetsp:Transcript_12146/g.27557  ORF Transcript_12146/g.27557 Transcript_12146/m.27557 type:complete len:239 (+) Transcript_12146:485-1201(+)